MPNWFNDEPHWRKEHYSGMCVCGHSEDDHHGNMVMNIEAFDATQEARSAGECEFYGWNECTDFHCPVFWDKDNPDPDRNAFRRAIDPSAKVGGCE